MSSEDPPASLLEDRPLEAPLPEARLLEILGGLDLTSADGRAGIGALLAEIERRAPGAILRQAARIELHRVGWPGRPGSEAPRAER